MFHRRHVRAKGGTGEIGLGAGGVFRNVQDQGLQRLHDPNEGRITIDGQDIPRKKGPGLVRSDLLVVNKTDLAPYVGVDPVLLESDTKAARGDRPYVMARLRQGVGVEQVVAFLEREGGLHLR